MPLTQCEATRLPSAHHQDVHLVSSRDTHQPKCISPELKSERESDGCLSFSFDIKSDRDSMGIVR